MNAELKLSKFAKYAWFVLAYNIIVILWGAFLRASLSGDGCGQYWLTCGGELVPSAPQFKTIIEFSHRLSTGLAFFGVLLLFVWAFRRFERGDYSRKTAFASFVFIVIEALIGAGLVLTGNTAGNWTPTRPFWMMAHLITTFSLLAVLTLTAWFASGGKPFRFNVQRKISILLAIAISGIFLVGVSGSVAALSSMLFPSSSLAESAAKDFSDTSHILLRLRISHPILSISVGVFLMFLAGWLKSRSKENYWTNRWANALTMLVLIQFAFGTLTLITLAPIVMQLAHLFLADAIWIVFVLMAASVLAEERVFAESKFSAKTPSVFREI
ncbi:MAG: COX15/CtaA family protein [Acidobacteria bacterium]|nr:COX15/CtaA family protein [Acidobacteriota bacterium]MCA1640093.1 COX15/CtaA family protein [Acidobacteriota bacterium]